MGPTRPGPRPAELLAESPPAPPSLLLPLHLDRDVADGVMELPCGQRRVREVVRDLVQMIGSFVAACSGTVSAVVIAEHTRERELPDLCRATQRDTGQGPRHLIQSAPQSGKIRYLQHWRRSPTHRGDTTKALTHSCQGSDQIRRWFRTHDYSPLDDNAVASVSFGPSDCGGGLPRPSASASARSRRASDASSTRPRCTTCARVGSRPLTPRSRRAGVRTSQSRRSPLRTDSSTWAASRWSTADTSGRPPRKH